MMIFTSCPGAMSQTLTGAIPKPLPGNMVSLSDPFQPALLSGILLDPQDPFAFSFLIRKGDTTLSEDEKKDEYERLGKYFLASLAIKDTEQWVNLSPYEGGRIISDSFGLTRMGRDLLAQDYFLKQLTASLMHPDTDLGQNFWKLVYARLWDNYGTTDIPVDTFNKVWILPDQAEVYEKGNGAIIVRSHLKVMTERDYIAIENNALSREVANENPDNIKKNDTALASSQAVREVLLPALEKEVNAGKNFSNLRQIVSAMILATWYKNTLRASFLGQNYADKALVKGVDHNPAENQEIYRQYVEAFQKGVFNLIREDVETSSEELIPRKYFSGGFERGVKVAVTHDNSMVTVMHKTAQAGKIDLAEVRLETAGVRRAYTDRTDTANAQQTASNFKTVIPSLNNGNISLENMWEFAREVGQNFPDLKADSDQWVTDSLRHLEVSETIIDRWNTSPDRDSALWDGVLRFSRLDPQEMREIDSTLQNRLREKLSATGLLEKDTRDLKQQRRVRNTMIQLIHVAGNKDIDHLLQPAYVDPQNPLVSRVLESIGNNNGVFEREMAAAIITATNALRSGDMSKIKIPEWLNRKLDRIRQEYAEVSNTEFIHVLEFLLSARLKAAFQMWNEAPPLTRQDLLSSFPDQPSLFDWLMNNGFLFKNEGDEAYVKPFSVADSVSLAMTFPLDQVPRIIKLLKTRSQENDLVKLILTNIDDKMLSQQNGQTPASSENYREIWQKLTTLKQTVSPDQDEFDINNIFFDGKVTRRYTQHITYSPASDSYQIIHQNGDLERWMPALANIFQQARTATNAEERREWISKFEWLFFNVNPFTRSGAALGDSLSMILQILASMPLRDRYESMDIDALVLPLGERANNIPQGVPGYLQARSVQLKSYPSFPGSDSNLDSAAKGGIDLDPAHWNMQLRKDPFARELSLPGAGMDNVHLDGLIPHVINIREISSLPIF